VKTSKAGISLGHVINVRTLPAPSFSRICDFPSLFLSVAASFARFSAVYLNSSVFVISELVLLEKASI